jgi:hypothetical protein
LSRFGLIWGTIPALWSQFGLIWGTIPAFWSRFGLIWGTIPSFVRRNRGRTRKTQSGYPVSGLQPGTFFRMRSRNSNHSTATFGYWPAEWLSSIQEIPSSPTMQLAHLNSALGQTLRLEVLNEMYLKNTVLWDMASRGLVEIR